MSMDAVPRISRAQSLDVFSSMANIAGYRAVIEAATSSAGSSPARSPRRERCRRRRSWWWGRGGRARGHRLCRRAWRDRAGHRPAPGGGRPGQLAGREYVSIESQEVEVSATGYAKEMGEDYKAREAQLYADQARDVDIIITTALIPGGRPRGSSPGRWWRR